MVGQTYLIYASACALEDNQSNNARVIRHVLKQSAGFEGGTHPKFRTLLSGKKIRSVCTSHCEMKLCS
jgi:hypothetical protein